MINIYIERLFEKKSLTTITLVLLAGLIIRLLLYRIGTYELDVNTFIAWSNRLGSFGFSGFYSDNWSDYLPGYLYVLWFLNKINNLTMVNSTLLYKLPAILADLATGFVIYKIVVKLKNQRSALVAASFYIFNPAVIANSTLWGQVDSLTALFSILAVWLVDRKLIFSAILLAVGVAVKPQAALAAPVVLFVMLKHRWKITEIAKYILISFLAFVAFFIPFGIGSENIFLFPVERISTTVGQYVYTSVNAFNFWGLFGFWKADSLATQMFGLVVLLSLTIIAAKKLFKVKGARYLLLSIVFAAGFLFTTRMHERHLLPVLTPLIVSAALDPILLISYLGFSLAYIANLRYSFVWADQNFKEIFPSSLTTLFIFLNLASFGLIFFSAINKLSLTSRVDKLTRSFTKARPNKLVPLAELVSKRQARYLLAIILAFSLFSRLFFLSSPAEEYFDEVYHAFTAREMLNGNPKAWEWWNENPEGFAYEWTHPPIAKEAMVIGMTVFGENAFGWRVIGALLGTGSVLLVYLIAKELFKNRTVGVLASAVFALDGLPLVMSRIGMNDSYILFFILLSVYLFYKDKYFLSAILLGLALASKWSALWAIPIFTVSLIVLKKKIKPSLLWFIILPPLVYLASYIPMFTSGHSLDIFWGVQKQMWWYHTGLDATHPFTSQWWSWPILARPIWLYTSGVDSNSVSNIYAMGNPVIFWTGFAAIIFSAIVALYERNKRLGLVVFSYLVFFVPWAASPRIMFLYHYLPSIPFLAISLGYILTRFVKPKYILTFFALALGVYVYFFPRYTGIKIPTWLDESYHWFRTW